MKYDIQKRVFLQKSFEKFKNYANVQRAYRTKYQSKTAPSICAIKNIISNYEKTGSVDRKRVVDKTKTMRTKSLVEMVEKLFLEDSKLSLRKAANLVPASISTIRNVAREELNLKPYKVPRTFKLLKPDYTKRLKFVEFVKSRRLNLETSFICSDEAFFYLHGGHNIQNDRIWAEFQPDELVEQPLNDDKVMVWCAFSAKKVYGPYFFEKTVNGDTYLDMLKKFFWPRYIASKKEYQSYFQQDGAPPHRKKEVQAWLKSHFGDRFLDLSIWPPRSPDLNPCDFSLWGYLKGKVYNPKPKNIHELKENIIREINSFKKIDRISIFSNMKKRLVLLEQENGGHIEHLLK